MNNQNKFDPPTPSMARVDRQIRLERAAEARAFLRLAREGVLPEEKRDSISAIRESQK
jgi:hypothetical protein